MDISKIREDFKKRFAKDAERVYVIGKPIVFFGCGNFSAGCTAGTAGAAAVARRSDERIVIEFSGSNKMTEFNLAAEENKSEYCALLNRVKKYGAKTGGADILLCAGNVPGVPHEILLITSLEGFMDNLPPKSVLAKLYGNYAENMLAFFGRKECFAVLRDDTAEYLPFNGGAVKLVLCYGNGKPQMLGNGDAAAVLHAAEMLKIGDYRAFGAELDKFTADLHIHRGTRKLADASKQTGEAYGTGVIGDGGIFAVVGNERVDAFVRAFGEIYRDRFGGEPKIYVVHAENSGIALG